MDSELPHALPGPLRLRQGHQLPLGTPYWEERQRCCPRARGCLGVFSHQPPSRVETLEGGDSCGSHEGLGSGLALSTHPGLCPWCTLASRVPEPRVQPRVLREVLRAVELGGWPCWGLQRGRWC